MLHYSWSTEKLLDESFYFFCSFWSKSFVSFSLKLWIWPSRCQTLSVKFVIIVKAQNVTPNIRLVMVILCKKMKWVIACGWRETFSGSHIYLFCAANSFCAFSYWNEDHQNCIQNFFNFVKRFGTLYMYIYRNVFRQYKSFPLWTTKSNAEKSRS